ncbi:MAG: LysM peptidoglycan-binding domain-containing protein [Tissierella sp.]|nr:LysM peptidoglycan-binding domain-containing protein [Tissierella sp.]
MLPIPPPNLTFKVANKNKVVEILNIGDVNILKSPGLSEFNFKILLPGQILPFAIYTDGFKNPKYFTDKFEIYKVEKKPVRFIVSRVAPWGDPLFDSNMLVSLEDYTIEEKAGEVGDIYVEIRLKQYKEYKTKVVEIKEIAEKKAIVTVKEERPTKAPATSYTVEAGDTLWAIAKKQLNDGSKYTEIAKLNNISNPNLIQPGQVLRLG